MANNQLQVEAPESMRGGDKVVDTTEDILDILNETQEEEEKAPKKEKEDTKEDKEGEESEDGEVKEEEVVIEEDEGTKEEAVDELITPVALKEITNKYPNLLKEFPFLEKAYYREKKFTEIFPTVQDAREAQERLENVANLEGEVLSGKTDTILKAIKDNDPKNFEKLVEDYLPALGRVSPEAFYHLMANHVRQTVLTLYQSGESTKNENLKNAALVLSDFFWPGQQPVPPRTFGNGLQQPVQQEDKLSQERQQFEVERFEYVATDVNSKVQNALKATIDNNLDKTNVMSDFIKKNAIKEIQETLDKTLMSDSRFRTHMNTLWQRAKQSNYNRSSMDSIRSTYLGKAKTVLGPIIVKVRNEALKGVRRSKDSESSEDKRGPIPTGRSAGESKSSGKSKSIPAGMSIDDYLMSD